MNKELIDYFKGDELAAGVWLGKYAYEGEKTPEDMHRRMAREFARADDKYREEDEEVFINGEYTKLSIYGQERDYLSEENIYQLFKDFNYIIPQGSIMYGLGRGTPVSLSNCFVIDSAEDSYGGIMLTDQEQAQLMKRRGGVGHDLSLLRPKGTKVHNSAKSSTGMASFMHRFSNTTREVAQDGRRGALMLSIDINHPDVMEFIKIKRDGTSVTGANVSIKLNNEFMKAVENDEDYILRFPCDMKFTEGVLPIIENYNELVNLSPTSYLKKVNAKEYWDEIIKSARNYAEPGLMYWDNVLDNDPAGVYEQYKPISSNPCGEQFLQAYDSCRLMAMNLFSFVINPFTDKAEIDYKKLYEVSYEQQRLADDLVDLEIEYIDRIINKIKADKEPLATKVVELALWEKIQSTAKEGRRTGCGITALADMLAALGLKYDSDEALRITDLVMKTKMEAELDCNIDLAILRGRFEGCNSGLEFGFKMDNYGKASYGKNKFYQMLLDEFPEKVERMCKYGRRSVSWSTIAPTGSVSILTQSSSGCEPVFMPFYMRRKKINPNDETSRVDFVDESGDSWQEFPVLHEKFKNWVSTRTDYTEQLEAGIISSVEELNKPTLQSLFEQSPWYGSTANDIDWIKRNEMQAILQKYTTNAISSTINLPSTTTEQEVSDIYMSGWKLGLKGQTVYVDGSRSGVLVDSSKPKATGFVYKDAVKRPKDLEAEVHHSVTAGISYRVIVGLLEGKPYEVFIDSSESDISGTGIVFKKGKGDYFFKKNDITTNISNTMTDEQSTISRFISMSLRHGTNIKYVVEQLRKADGDMFSFSKSVARVLKKYIPDGEEATISCEECGGNNVVFEEGCSKCLSCGHSACS